MLTVFEDTEQIFRALRRRCKRLSAEASSAKNMLEAIHEVRDGGSPMSAPIARKVGSVVQGRPDAWR